MKKMYKCFMVLMLLSSIGSIRSEAHERDKALIADITVTGKIVAFENNEPLPGVTIVLKGTGKGTATDAKGEFTITVPNNKAVLVFSYVGYLSQEQAVGNQTKLNISLVQDSKALDEVVVVGYGTEKKRDLSGSIASVSADEIKATPITSFEQGLQGRVAGVQVMQGNSAPGGAPQVRIRGANTVLGGNEPLYIIDGVPVYNSDLETNNNLNVGTQPSNALASINPNDVVSMEILKDASATAIYGARGANGVVIITTKRGQASERGKISFEAYHGIQEISNKLKLMNTQDFIKIINERTTNFGGAPRYLDPSIYTTSTDWQDFFFRKAPMSNYSLNFSGGTTKNQYSISGNWFNQEGVIQQTNFNRGSVRVNLDNRLNDKFKVSTSITASRSTNNRSLNYVLMNAMQFSPLLSPYDKDGNFANLNTVDTGGENPVEALYKTSDKLTVDRFLGNVLGEYTIIDGLTYSLRLAMDNLTQHNDIYVKKGSFIYPSPGATVKENKGNNYVIEHLFNYKKVFRDNHKINITAGYTWQENNTVFFQQSGTGFQFDDFGTYNLGAAAITNPNVSFRNKSTLLSYLGRANYVLKDKYIFTLTGRADGSSRFGDNNKWGYFPSGAVAWRISKESFMKNLNFISDLKLRTSYGMTGNQEIGLYNSISRFSSVQGVMGSPLVGFVGYVPTSLANNDLKWEINKQFDAGFDISLLKDQISLTTDYYIKRTEDLLANLPIPGSSGFSSILINSGSIENKGFEVGLKSTLIERKNLNWTIGGNISRNETKVLKLAVATKQFFAPNIPSPIDRPVNIIREGEVLSSFWGYKEDGLDENGDIKYKDLNGDGKVDGNDQTILGSPFPNLIYGFNSNISYKGLTLSIFFQGVEGVKVFNSNDFMIANSVTRISNQLEEVNDRWTPENKNPNAKYPRASTKQLLVSDRFVQDADYLRLRNISLSYNIPTSKVGVKWIDAAKIYISGQNLLTFTKYHGYDPEVSQTGSNSLVKGLDRGSYPANKTITLGINLSIK
jgi:TonB-dependent starch-binding outer membrane protein SusC